MGTIFAACLVCTLTLCACKSEKQSPTEEQRTALPASSTATADAKSAARQDTRPVIAAFGDSLTAGVVENTYPEYLQQLLDEHGYTYRVDNQGVSGDTTTDGLARIGNVIAAHPVLVILEFGGNDGLRGIPVTASKQNMEEMIGRLKEAKIPVVLAGMTLPPNYGPDYVQPFTAMFPELAKEFNIRLLPFFLLHVYRHGDMMQPDGIHPNGAGNKVVAQDVFTFIQPVLVKGAAPVKP